jgi:hypothetical protein
MQPRPATMLMISPVMPLHKAQRDSTAGHSTAGTRIHEWFKVVLVCLLLELSQNTFENRTPGCARDLLCHAHIIARQAHAGQ